MIGAIIGDIVGSVYEFNNIKTKDFPLFGKKNFFTDDTVMTIAIAESIMHGGKPDNYPDSYIGTMKKYGNLYFNVGYGSKFKNWLRNESSEPYNSWGNGSAMRVSPVAYAFNSLEEVEHAAKICAAVTHNHPEGVKGAQATAAAVFLARTRKSKPEIKTYIENKYNYDLSRTLEEIRPTYKFYVSCQKSVPEAIIAFLESTDFEDAIRNAISLGGDSDTLTAITGSIAEAAYGVPDEIADKALSYLDTSLLEVYNQWKKFINRTQETASHTRRN
jgi:ADP-ribosylglycohydrolase